MAVPAGRNLVFPCIYGIVVLVVRNPLWVPSKVSLKSANTHEWSLTEKLEVDFSWLDPYGVRRLY